MAEDDARAIGRLEQKAETASEEIGALEARAGRMEERVGHLERAFQPLKRDLGSLNVEAQAHGTTLADHGTRIAALEAPIAKARADRATRYKRMRALARQVGGTLFILWTVFEWVAKPIVGFVAEQWWRGSPPPGH